MTGMAGGPPIDRRSLPGRVRRDVGCEPEPADIGNEVFGVVALVTRDGSSSCHGWEPFEHLERSGTFGVSGRFGEFGVDDQRVAMLHQQMARVTELRGGSALAGHP